MNATEYVRSCRQRLLLVHALSVIVGVVGVSSAQETGKPDGPQAIVYKTTRCRNLREVPAAALVLWITIVIGMYAVGISLWVLFQVMA